MIIVTKDRGPLKAKSILFLPYSFSHDMLVEWEDGSTEHMRKHEIEMIISDPA